MNSCRHAACRIHNVKQKGERALAVLFCVRSKVQSLYKVWVSLISRLDFLFIAHNSWSNLVLRSFYGMTLKLGLGTCTRLDLVRMPIRVTTAHVPYIVIL